MFDKLPDELVIHIFAHLEPEILVFQIFIVFLNKEKMYDGLQEVVCHYQR